MSFLSADFILWMAGVVMGHFLLPRRYQMGFVVLATLAFLLVYSPWSALILLGLSIPTYFFMGHWRNKAVVVLQLVLFITLIFISYKYLLQTSKGVPSRDWLLLGASFYILRIIHYIIESYKGGLPQHSFGDYLTYMLFLPVLVTGPAETLGQSSLCHRA